MRKYNILLPFLWGIGFLYPCSASLNLEDLFKTETLVIKTLKSYIFAQEGKLNILKQIVNKYKKGHNEVTQDIESYVSHPVNAYLFVKRLTVEWKQVQKIVFINSGEEYITHMLRSKDRYKFPTKEDLNELINTLLQLQETYSLSVSSLASGRVKGLTSVSEISATDCFRLGRLFFDKQDYNNSYLWLTEANKRHEQINDTAEITDTLQYIAFSVYKLGNISLALELTNKVVEIIPDHPTAGSNKLFFEREISKEEERNAAIRDKELYMQLCKGEITAPKKISKKLKCRYVNNDNVFLKIAPFKMEEASIKPKILIFHDVMSDDEINTIKEISKPYLKCAEIKNSRTGKTETENRISETTFLKGHEHKHIANVFHRTKDMTGISLKHTKKMQVLNYGLGGHHEPYLNLIGEYKINEFESLGHKLATIIFYMSDVHIGGATVFPTLNITVWPRKGSAILWYNLHRNGERNKSTKYGTCPALVGSKWVSMFWLHEFTEGFGM